MRFLNLNVGMALLSLSLRAQEPLLVHSERPLQAESSYEALEPFETPLSGFFIRNHHDVPVVDFEEHKVVINGLVENPMEWTVRELRQLPQKSFYAVLECSGNRRGFQTPAAGGIQWSEGAVGNAEWEGVSLKELLEKAHPKKEAKFITVRGADKPALPATPEFIRSIPLSKALENDTLLALKMNREALPLLHGGPVRLVVPRWYGQNWVKWITEITLTAEEDSGFYMRKAYRMPQKPVKIGEAWNAEEGLPIQELLVQSLIVKPSPHSLVPLGKTVLKGKAFSGKADIAEVEVSQDRGKTWKGARLLSAHPKGGWREFEFETKLTKAGKKEFISRARDKQGNIQPLKHPWNPPGYLRNSVSGVQFWALSSKEFEGSQVYQTQCLICHSEGLSSSQKFDRKGWAKLLVKMKSFGVQVQPEEEEPLIDFLMGLSKRRSNLEEKSSYEIQKLKFQAPDLSSRVNTSEVKKLYEMNCSQCHGEQGEGKIGPRLRSRLIPQEVFVVAVTQGKNRMPAFGEALNASQIRDLWKYLQVPSHPF